MANQSSWLRPVSASWISHATNASIWYCPDVPGDNYSERIYMDTVICVAAAIGFGLAIGQALRTGEVKRKRTRIRRDEYPLYFYSCILMYVGGCLLTVAIFSGLFAKLIWWSI
jgi:hypothetical protein